MFTTYLHPQRLFTILWLCLLLAFPAPLYAAPAFSSNPAPAALPATMEIRAAWQTITNASEGFQLQIPAGWQVLQLSELALDLGMDLTGANNPQLQNWLNSPVFRQMVANGMKFYAIDLSNSALGYTLPPNANVIKLPLGADLPLETVKTLNERQLQSIAAAGYPVYSQIVNHHGRPALLFQYVLAFDMGLGEAQLTQINQLLLTEKGVQYILTVGVPLAVADNYVGTVTRILDSFQLTNTSFTATVQASSLNVRTGPGMGYGTVGYVNRGEILTVLGQVANCNWLKVETPQRQQGWVAGAAQYVTLGTTCNSIPVVLNISIKNLPLINMQGCINFHNNINDELTITFTSKDGKWNETFKVARKTQHRHCFTPDDYTFTVDAPPPWGSFNDRLFILPGANIPYPING